MPVVHVRIGSEELRLDWDEWERRVREGRVPPEALVRFDPVTGPTWRVAGELELYRSLADASATAFARAQARGGPPLLTALLVGVQVRIWWLAQLPPVGVELETRFTKWTSPTLEQGEVWRLLTMGFLHTGFVHATMNLLWLGYTSWHLERALGWRSVLVVYLASVTSGSLLSMIGAPDSPSLGASGGVFGLIAAAVVFGFVRPELLPERSRRVFGFALLPYLLGMFVSGLRNAGTDNWSHLGGLLAGGLLAVLADPPGFERRRGWNARWQGATAGAIAALLLALGLLGPALQPLRPEHLARHALLARTQPDAAARLAPTLTEGPVRHGVPVGWIQDRDVFGTPGWAAPLGARALSVTEETLGEPLGVDALWSRWRERLARRGLPHELDEPRPAVVAGLPGIEVRGRVRIPREGTLPARLRAVPGEGPIEVDVVWRGAVRGIRGLVEVWQVEPGLAPRVATLHERVQASVGWPEPETLVEARAAHARAPGRADARRALATALSAAGDAAGAIALQLSLVEEHPTSRRDREALLRTLAWYPDALPDLDGTLQATLDADLGPKLTVAVADVLDAAGRPAAARGLLELAWARAPGERTLARGLVARGVSTDLHPSSHVPMIAWWDAARQSPRDPRAVEALRQGPLSLARAEAVGREALAARDALAERAAREVAEGRADVVGTLALLLRGHPALDAPTALADLTAGLRRAAAGDPPDWWHGALPAPEVILRLVEPLPEEARLPRIPALR